MNTYEKRHIEQNLAVLQNWTSCSCSFLKLLQDLGILTEVQVRRITNTAISEQSRILYRLLMESSPCSISLLKTSLEDEEQFVSSYVIGQYRGKPCWKATTSGKFIYNTNAILSLSEWKNDVYFGRYMDNINTALKTITLQHSSRDQIIQSLEDFKKLKKHVNVVEILYVELKPTSQIFVALELCSFNLECYIISKIFLTTNVDIMGQSATGLRFLHQNKITHRNIKPQNILVAVQSSGVLIVKLTDYGITPVHKYSRTNDYISTQSWIAPEILQSSLEEKDCNIPCYYKMEFASDIFSLGCVYYYILTNGLHPFGNGFQCEYNIYTYNFNLDSGKIQPNDIRALPLVRRMISYSPVARPSTGMVLSHPYFVPEGGGQTSGYCSTSLRLKRPPLKQKQIRTKTVSDFESSNKNFKTIQLLQLLKDPSRSRTNLSCSNQNKANLTDALGSMDVCIVSIVGEVKSGKSSLANAFLKKLGSSSRFASDQGRRKTTKGVWVSGQTLRTVNNIPTFIMDVEGIELELSSSDQALLLSAIPILFSSVIVLNMIGDLSLEVLKNFSTLLPPSRIYGSKHQKLYVVVHDWTNIRKYPYGAKGGNRLLKDFVKTEIGRKFRHIMQFFRQTECYLLPSPMVEVNYVGSSLRNTVTYSTEVKTLCTQILQDENLPLENGFGVVLNHQTITKLISSLDLHINKPFGLGKMTSDVVQLICKNLLHEQVAVETAFHYDCITSQPKAVNSLPLYGDEVTGISFSMESLVLPEEQEQFCEPNKDENELSHQTQAQKENEECEENANIVVACELLREKIKLRYPALLSDYDDKSLQEFYDGNELESSLSEYRHQAEELFLSMFNPKSGYKEESLKRVFAVNVDPLLQHCICVNVDIQDSSRKQAVKEAKYRLRKFKKKIDSAINLNPHLNLEEINEHLDTLACKATKKFLESIKGPETFKICWKEYLEDNLRKETQRVYNGFEKSVEETMQLVHELANAFNTEITNESKSVCEEKAVHALIKSMKNKYLLALGTRSNLNIEGEYFIRAKTSLENAISSKADKIIQETAIRQQAVLNQTKKAFENAKKKIGKHLKSYFESRSVLPEDEIKRLVERFPIYWTEWFVQQLSYLGIGNMSLENEVDLLKSYIAFELKKLRATNTSRKQEADRIVKSGKTLYTKSMAKEIVLGAQEFKKMHNQVMAAVISNQIKDCKIMDKAFIEHVSLMLKKEIITVSKTFFDAHPIVKSYHDAAVNHIVEEVKSGYEKSMETLCKNAKSGNLRKEYILAAHKRIKEASIQKAKSNKFFLAAHEIELAAELDFMLEIYLNQNDQLVDSLSKFMPALGIDIGTNKCCAAIYYQNKIIVIPNKSRENTVISTSIRIQSDGTKVFDEPDNNYLHKHAQSTITCINRIIGKNFNDSDFQEELKFWGFQVVNDNGRPVIKCFEKSYQPEEILSYVLTHLKQIAQDFLEPLLGSTQVENIVITIPLLFTDYQRRATIDAAHLAGLNVLGLICKTTAACLIYQHQHFAIWEERQSENVIIFQLGVKTCSVAIIEVHEDRIDIKNVGMDPSLGGEAFDKNLLTYCKNKAAEVLGTDLLECSSVQDESANKTDLGLNRLHIQCEKAKRSLTSANETIIEVGENLDERQKSFRITRDQFEALNEDLYQRITVLVESVLQRSVLLSNEITYIILQGGNTRMPKLQLLLQNLFPTSTLNKRLMHEDTISRGAALYATMLSKSFGSELIDCQINDITPWDIEIRSEDNRLVLAVPSGTRLPQKFKERYHIAVAEQAEVTFNAFYVTNTDMQLTDRFASFQVTRIPVGVTEINIFVLLDLNGILQLTATAFINESDEFLLVHQERPGLTEEQKALIFHARKQYNTVDSAAHESWLVSKKDNVASELFMENDYLASFSNKPGLRNATNDLRISMNQIGRVCELPTTLHIS